MAITSGFLIAGLLMTLAGAILIYMSLKASPSELAEADGVLFIGTLPIVVKDERKWILTALVITSVLIMYLAVKNYYPGVFGGVI